MTRRKFSLSITMPPGSRPRPTFCSTGHTWKWRARAETAGTTVNVGHLAIAVLQLVATPAPVRHYMALAG